MKWNEILLVALTVWVNWEIIQNLYECVMTLLWVNRTFSAAPVDAVITHSSVELMYGGSVTRYVLHMEYWDEEVGATMQTCLVRINPPQMQGLEHIKVHPNRGDGAALEAADMTECRMNAAIYAVLCLLGLGACVYAYMALI